MNQICRIFAFFLLALIFSTCDKSISNPEAGNTYKIAFTGFSASQREQVYLIDSDGSNQRVLDDSLSGDSRSLSWSPDGGRIAFYNEENMDIYVIDADGKNLKNLTNNPAQDKDAVWSPDGRKIVFFSNRDGQPSLYSMNSDGNNQQRLITTPDLGGSVVWSPNSNLIAYTRTVLDTSRIHIMDADGANPRLLTTHSLTSTSPSWSPDGSTIAFSAGMALRGGIALSTWEVYTISLIGEDLRQLTSNSGYDGGSVWSSDGEEIFFISDRDGLTIYKMNADGSNQRRVANVGDGASLNFSKDKKVAIYYPSTDFSKIYLMNIDGTNRRRLTTNNANLQERYAVWSPIP